MLDQLKELLASNLESLRALSPTKLFLLLGAIASAIALTLVVALWLANQTEYGLLYRDLTLEDAAAITNKLREMEVLHELKRNGTTIMVPIAVLEDIRLQLASDGLPRGGGAGFELFDQNSFGMTEFMQKLNYQRALQGELARTISQIGVVQSARVHIVLPEKSLFIDQQEKASGSVILRLTPGSRLRPDQIRGIKHLVASSVEGLKAEDVTLVDANGEQLEYTNQDPNGLTPSEGQLEYQHTLEFRLERRVQSLLGKAVGKDKVIVRVSARLDFQHIERSEERYDSDNPAIRSEQRSSEAGQGNGFSAIGVPGARSNVEQPTPEQDKQVNTASRQSETINYEISKVLSKVVAPSGEIRRLSVAILIDGSYQPGNQGGENLYMPRTTEELDKFQEIVKGAIGYDEQRGDRIEIVNVPFASQDNDEEQRLATETQRSFWLQIGRYGAYIILAVLGYFFIARPLIKTAIKGQNMIATSLPRTVQELEEEMGTASELLEGQTERHQLAEGGRPDQIVNQKLRTQVNTLVLKEPERAAEILRIWLKA